MASGGDNSFESTVAADPDPPALACDPGPSEGFAELDELVAIDAQRRRLEFRESVLLAQVAAANMCDIEHGHTTTQWFADRTKQGHVAARNRVQAARQLHGSFPALAEALGVGSIGWQHVGVFTRAANERNAKAMAGLIGELVELAQVATFDRWAREVRGIGQRLDADGGYDPATDPANNHLHLVPTFDGVTHISGQLVGELALSVRKLITAETERLLTRYRSAAEATDGDVAVPSHAQATAEALAELVERAAGVPDGNGKLPEPEIVVVMNGNDSELSDDDGHVLSPEILRFIIAAGLIRPLENSDAGDPLRMGRVLRYANRHQRRALLARDGGCIFPGCDRPAGWCDAHHVDHWDSGGPTDIENMGLLCRFHHRVTHRPGWEMTRDPNITDRVKFRWRTPSGRTITSQRHHQRDKPTAA